MDDTQIVDLYFARSEMAIKETNTSMVVTAIKSPIAFSQTGRIPRKVSVMPIYLHGTSFLPADLQNSLHFWGN